MDAKKTCNGISFVNVGYYVGGLTARVSDSNEGCDGVHDERMWNQLAGMY